LECRKCDHKKINIQQPVPGEGQPSVGSRTHVDVLQRPRLNERGLQQGQMRLLALDLFSGIGGFSLGLERAAARYGRTPVSCR
jgi:hypothetical protein